MKAHRFLSGTGRWAPDRRRGTARVGPAARRLVAFAALTIALQASGCRSRSSSEPEYPVPFSTVGDRLGVWDGQVYQPVFLKGADLGVAVPGTLPGELAATSDQYRRWFSQMAAMGANVVRVYTLHYPRFYQELARYNAANPRHPLYVLHGIWLDEDNPTNDMFDMTESFDTAIQEVVDCVHGHRVISHRYGKAYGTYDTSISRWVIGWIVGREVSPPEASTTNAAMPDVVQFQGQALALPQGRPLEVWFAQRLDGLILYERDTYGVERPVSVASWPTLDPLHHPTESRSTAEDTQSLDLANLDTSQAPAGYFATYHVYPFYPDFMSEDPGYDQAADALGPDSYLGYLLDLKAHYAKIPLLVGELGVPSSWGDSHFAQSGMDHGGQDEGQQGDQIARQLHNVHDAGCAGGIVFSWIDEWWKRSWIVDDLAMPSDRYALWHNVTNPEQNFGLIAFDLGEPAFNDPPLATGSGRVQTIRAATDAEYLHLRVGLKTGLEDGEQLVIGFDTYGDDVGDSVLPNGVQTARRSELALVVQAPSNAQLEVTQAYDLVGIWHHTSTDGQMYHSIATDGAPWDPVRWKNGAAHQSADGSVSYPDTTFEIGQLRVRRASDPSTSRDAVVLSENGVDLRIPWTLLQFTDPSTHSVMNDDRATTDRVETAVSDGIAVSVSLGTELVETARAGWDGWEKVPRTQERVKASFARVAAAMAGL
jgi:hypothetical protein